MKLHSERSSTAHDAASSASAPSFTRGSSLRGAMGGVLSGSLEALGERLNPSTWFAREPREPKAAVSRLREVLDRDRALIAANPELNLLDAEAQLAPVLVAPVVARAIVSEPVAPAIALAPPALAPELVVSSSAPIQTAVIECREPIRTRTMARLLASQGHRERALSIYDYLLARPNADASMRSEAEALRSAPD